MFEISQAIYNHMEYEQTSDGRWRAIFRGAISASAEARTPEAASWEVRKELERLVAAWIVKTPAAPAEPTGRLPEGEGKNGKRVVAAGRRKLRSDETH